MTTARFAFDTSWGSRYDPSGTRFRLWAPSAASVELAYEPRVGASPLEFRAMEAGRDGWWEIVTDVVKLGFGYGFRVDGQKVVPDPAARAQMRDVHSLSRLVDPRTFGWRTAEWKGRPWHECVFYELHVGTFTAEGTFEAAIGKLDHLVATGITAIEILPVAQFTGDRGWGYDGTLLYCPHKAYGGPEGFKQLVDAAHERGLMVFLDVVYNHFGPEGNFLPGYVPEFFNADVETAWGAGIAYDQPPVRQFLIENALYWLEEFRLDGLRLDAIDSIKDTSDPTFVKELAARVRSAITDRQVHITTEDDRNITWHIERDADGSIPLVSGEWNDDFHHTAHVLALGEREGYYGDYETRSAGQMAKALATGFVYQGNHSDRREKDVGSSSGHLPPTAFVNFLQNHDQVGNRAFGDRLKFLASARAYDCLQAIHLLSPQIPLMFQGDEFGDTTPFCYFTDFEGELGEAVSDGRKSEFSSFSVFEDPDAAEVFPDPNDESSCEVSKLDWALLRLPTHKRCHQVTRGLLRVRREVLMPLLATIPGGRASSMVDGRAFAVAWPLADGRVYHLFANLTDETWMVGDPLDLDAVAGATPVYANHRQAPDELKDGKVSAYTAVFVLSDAALFGP